MHPQARPLSSSLFNHIWYGRRIPESLRYEHGKPHTVSSLFNQPYMVRSSHSRKFTLVARKDWLRHVACSMANRDESAQEREERLRRRRERYRIRRERETNEETEARFVKRK